MSDHQGHQAMQNLPTDEQFQSLSSQEFDPTSGLDLTWDDLEALTIDELIRQDKAESSPLGPASQHPPIPAWYLKAYGNT